MFVSAIPWNESAVYVCRYFLPLKPPSPHPPVLPLQVITEPWAELPVLSGSFPLAVCFMHSGVYVNPNLPICSTFPFPPWVHTSGLYICISIPTLQIGSFEPFFWIPYIFTNTWYLLLCLTSLYMTDSRFISVTENDPLSFLFMAE